MPATCDSRPRSRAAARVLELEPCETHLWSLNSLKFQTVIKTACEDAHEVLFGLGIHGEKKLALRGGPDSSQLNQDVHNLQREIKHSPQLPQVLCSGKVFLGFKSNISIREKPHANVLHQKVMGIVKRGSDCPHAFEELSIKQKHVETPLQAIVGVMNSTGGGNYPLKNIQPLPGLPLSTSILGGKVLVELVEKLRNIKQCLSKELP